MDGHLERGDMTTQQRSSVLYQKGVYFYEQIQHYSILKLTRILLAYDVAIKYKRVYLLSTKRHIHHFIHVEKIINVIYNMQIMYII